MRTISFEDSSDRLTEVLDSVAHKGEVMITRPGRGAVVLVPLSDYEALNETVHLLRSPTNARRLLDAIERLERRRADCSSC